VPENRHIESEYSETNIPEVVIRFVYVQLAVLCVLCIGVAMMAWIHSPAEYANLVLVRTQCCVYMYHHSALCASRVVSATLNVMGGSADVFLHDLGWFGTRKQFLHSNV
jgi:hypothetical protein